MSSYLDTTLMGGMRHRTHRKRGMGILSDIISSVGLGRKRHHKKRGGSVKVAHKSVSGLGKRRHRVHRTGRGIFDKIKSGLTSALKFAGPIVGSAILGKAGSAIGSKVFGGRKRRVHHKKTHHVSLSALIQKLKGGRRHRKRV